MNSIAAKLVLGAATLLSSFLLSLQLQAQDTQGTLSGTVTDSSGGLVAGAKISVKNSATGQATETQTTLFGFYSIPGLIPGDYEISVSGKGFSSKVVKVTLAAGAKQTLDFRLATPSSTGGELSLEDLGFSKAQTQGSSQNQAMLDKRSHMLKTHQRLGLITAAPLTATIITSLTAKGKRGSGGNATGRDLHAALGATTVGMYLTTAYFAIRAPKVPGTPTRGPIRAHKALAWVHGTGMILTPILGGMAFAQQSQGERVHGIAKAHSVVGVVTGAAYGAAILSVSLKF